MSNNLTPLQYTTNFNDPQYKLIRVVRIDSPRSPYKKKSSGSEYDAQVLVFLIQENKREFYTAIYLAANFEADGTTLKKDSSGYLDIVYDLLPYTTKLKKDEMEELVADSAIQMENIKNAINYLNMRKKEVGFPNSYTIGGDWSVIQDPWDPNTLVEAIPSTIISDQKKNEEEFDKYSNPASATASGTSSVSEPTTAEDNGSPTKNTGIDPTKVTGKFILKVKSGPGVIIGITEVDIIDGKADFSGIQFDEPGDYVVTVSCTSPDVESTEIRMKVLPEVKIIPQDQKGATESNVSGTRPIIAQIDRPTLTLPSMVFSRQGTDTTSSTQVANTIGLTPFLNYNGSQINDRDIQSLTLYHDGLVPKVDIIFRDTNGMISKEPPRDDTKFEVFLNSRSPNLKSIHLKFKIDDFQKLQTNQYSMSGTIDISKLYRNKFKVRRGTSFEILRDICKGLEIGFNSNIDNTNDNMAWRNIGDKEYKFMESVIKHSYISEESFMAGYIDFYYCFNYVDIEKEMKRDIKDDVGIDTGGVSDPAKPDSSKIVKLMLTSEKGQQSSNMFFLKKSERNESTKISMQQGYKTRTKFYDRVKKMFLVFDVDSTTSDGSKSHILKGAEGDKEAFDNNYVTKYNGKIDTDNTHNNYNYAVTQNRINLDNMMKNQLDISLPNPNFNLYRFQKIQLFIIKEAATVSAPETIQWRYSGEWLIASIKFVFLNGALTQEITLARKEMGKNPDEIKEGTNNGVKETKDQKNENPIVGTASETITNNPNSKYKVGEVLTVQDSEGKRYVLTISKLSENGTDVVASLKYPGTNPNTAITGPDTIAGVTQSTVLVATASGATYSGGYPFEVTLEYGFGGEDGDFTQSRVTELTKNHPWIKQNGTWQGNTFIREETGDRISEDENLEDSKSIFIAIKRPLPTYKPSEDWQKSMTPFNWTIFELKDEGITLNDMSKVSSSSKYNGLKYRIFHGIECYVPYFQDSAGKDQRWYVPKGYIKIIDEEGKTVIESAYTDTTTKKTGAISINETTRGYLTQGGFAGDPPKFEYYRWFALPGNGSPTASVLVAKDQEYTQVGGKNTIYYDMSNPDIYKPGVYTIEIKYYVPVYEKEKNERIMFEDANGYSAYEEKTLKNTFTIVKKSKKK
jgi:hypothetical protein